MSATCRRHCRHVGPTCRHVCRLRDFETPKCCRHYQPSSTVRYFCITMKCRHFPTLKCAGKATKKIMLVSRHHPVGRILPRLSSVGNMLATCRRHSQLRCPQFIFKCSHHLSTKPPLCSLLLPWCMLNGSGVQSMNNVQTACIL